MPGVWEVIGSNPVGESAHFFFVPRLSFDLGVSCDSKVNAKFIEFEV